MSLQQTKWSNEWKTELIENKKNVTFFLAKYSYYCREMFSLLENMGFFYTISYHYI